MAIQAKKWTNEEIFVFAITFASWSKNGRKMALSPLIMGVLWGVQEEVLAQKSNFNLQNGQKTLKMAKFGLISSKLGVK